MSSPTRRSRATLEGGPREATRGQSESSALASLASLEVWMCIAAWKVHTVQKLHKCGSLGAHPAQHPPAYTHTERVGSVGGARRRAQVGCEQGPAAQVQEAGEIALEGPPAQSVVEGPLNSRGPTGPLGSCGHSLERTHDPNHMTTLLPPL